MERIIIFYARNRFKETGLSPEMAKQILFKNYNGNLGIDSLELDHIIPYCICNDSSITNLQLLSHKIHRNKSLIDRKIIKKFKLNGWIDSWNHYSMELLVSINFLKEEYLKEFAGLVEITGLGTYNPSPSELYEYNPSNPTNPTNYTQLLIQWRKKHNEKQNTKRKCTGIRAKANSKYN